MVEQINWGITNMIITPDLAQAPVKKEGEKKEMLSYSFLADGRIKIKINSSSLDILQTCMKKTEFALVRNLRAKTEGNATRFGSAIHAALETYYMGSVKHRKFKDGCRENFQMIKDGGGSDRHEDCLLCNSVRSFVGSVQFLTELDQHDMHSVESGIWLLETYFDKYLLDPFEILMDKEGKPMVEKQFTTLLIDNEDMVVELFGTIDAILRNLNSGQILVTDHKTTGMLGNDFFNRIKPNHQFTGYVIGAQKVLGLDTDVFLVNGIQKKKLPKRATTAPPNLVRQTTTRSPEDIEAFKIVVKNAVLNLIRALKTEEFPQGTTNSCAMYGGCNFLEICSVPEKIRENIIKVRYE